MLLKDLFVLNIYMYMTKKEFQQITTILWNNYSQNFWIIGAKLVTSFISDRSHAANVYIKIKTNLSCFMRKPTFCICEIKGADQLSRVTAKLISAFVFATQILQFLCFLNPKFLASSHLLCLYSSVYVGFLITWLILACHTCII